MMRIRQLKQEKTLVIVNKKANFNCRSLASMTHDTRTYITILWVTGLVAQIVKHSETNLHINKLDFINNLETEFDRRPVSASGTAD